MGKKLGAVIVGLIAIVGFGAGAMAQEARSATATPSEVDPGATFSVMFSPCFPGEVVTFEFQGQRVSAECDGIVTLQDSRSQALAPGTASASLTAPQAAGNYTGFATANLANQIQGLRRPTSGARISGKIVCDPFNCATFQVTVRQATTTTASTTTAAPTTAAPTTAAPTTSAVGAVPPAPTTTVAPVTLPATGPSRNDNTATIAIVLVVAGGALLLAARRRGSHGAT